MASEIAEKIQSGTIRNDAFKKDRRVEDDEIAMFPCRLVAPSLLRRWFILLNTEPVIAFPSTQDAFQDLQRDPVHKKIVRSLLKNHLDR